MNPTPSDVALFHELVHAYHTFAGSKATGPISAEQAIHPGEVGVAMSEYQAVGLDSADGDRQHQYSGGAITENKYRSQSRQPHRDTYLPRTAPAPKRSRSRRSPRRSRRRSPAEVGGAARDRDGVGQNCCPNVHVIGGHLPASSERGVAKGGSPTPRPWLVASDRREGSYRPAIGSPPPATHSSSKTGAQN